MSRRRAFWVVAVAGALAGHAVGYAAGGTGTGGHGYLAGLTVVLVPVVAAALVATAVRMVRVAAAPIRPGALVAAQIGILLTQETLEGAVHGLGPFDVIGLPAVRWAVLAQVAVALVLLLALRLGATAVRALRTRRRLRGRAPGVPVVVLADVRDPAHDVPVVLLRGPPSLVFA